MLQSSVRLGRKITLSLRGIHINSVPPFYSVLPSTQPITRRDKIKSVIARIFTVLITTSGCVPLKTSDQSASSNLKDLQLSKPTKQKFVDAFGSDCTNGIDVSTLRRTYTTSGGSQTDDACEMLSNILDTYSLTITEGQNKLPVETGTFRVGEAQSTIPSISLNVENSYSIILEFGWSKDPENVAIFGGQANITSQELASFSGRIVPLSVSLKATASGGVKYGLLAGASVNTPAANKDAQIDPVFEGSSKDVELDIEFNANPAVTVVMNADDLLKQTEAGTALALFRKHQNQVVTIANIRPLVAKGKVIGTFLLGKRYSELDQDNAEITLTVSCYTDVTFSDNVQYRIKKDDENFRHSITGKLSSNIAASPQTTENPLSISILIEDCKSDKIETIKNSLTKN